MDSLNPPAVPAEAQLPTSVAVPSFDVAMVGQASKFLAMCEGFTVDSAELYQDAAEDLAKVKGLAKRIEDTRAALKAPILEAGRAIDAFFNGPKTMLTRAEGAIKGAMIAFDREQEAKAEAARRAAAEEAEKQRRAIEEEAERLRAKGETFLADTVASTAAVVAVQAPPPPAPVRVAGVTRTKVWKVEVTDAKALIKHSLENGLLTFISIDEGALRKYAQATDGAAVPGVTFKQESGIGSRAAK